MPVHTTPATSLAFCSHVMLVTCGKLVQATSVSCTSFFYRNLRQVLVRGLSLQTQPTSQICQFWSHGCMFVACNTAVKLVREKNLHKKPCQTYIAVIRPPRTVVPRGLILPVMFFYLFRHEISGLPRPIAVKLRQMIAIWLRFITQVQKLGGPPPNTLGAQNMQNLRQFHTASHFDHEYLRNGSTYRKSEK